MSEKNQAETVPWPGVHCTSTPEDHCITCSDAALAACVIEVNFALARVTTEGQTTEVDISLVDQVAVGDHLLIHGGVAIARLPAAEH